MVRNDNDEEGFKKERGVRGKKDTTVIKSACECIKDWRFFHSITPINPFYLQGQCLYTYLELDSKSTKAAVDVVHDLAV